MNRLSSILPAAQVLVSVDATSKKRALKKPDCCLKACTVFRAR